MGSGAHPEPDPLLRLRYYEETGQAEEAKRYRQYLADTGQLKPSPRPETPADTASQEAVADDTEPGYGRRLVTHILSAAQGIPGVEAVEAAAGSLGSKFTDNPLSYRESLETLRNETGRIGGKTRAAEKLLVGGAATLPLLPANPAAAGAILGGAEQALDADPNSLEMRLLRTGAGAAGGAILGKGGELAVAGARTMLAPNTAKVLEELVANRAQSSGPLYRKALSEGVGKTNTPMVRAFLKRPDVAEIVGELQQTRPFAGVKAEDPKMLDAVYKVLSDRSALAKRQAEAVTPSRPNIGRFRRDDIKMAQEEALDAMSGGKSLPGPMPTYRPAVQDYAEKSGTIDAAQRGHDAVRSRLNRNLPMAKSLKKTSKESFEDYLNGASETDRDAAAMGIRGATKAAFGQSVRKSGQRALRNMPSLLRKTGSREQKLLDDLVKAGVLVGVD